MAGPDGNFKPGYVQHTLGWPLDDKTGGGSWMYHFGDNYVSVGFVVHLNYKNPFLSPFDEFQRFKQHPQVRRFLEGGKRIAYGARAICEGGVQSVPKLAFPGGVLLGDSAGFVNVPRIKGSHNAVRSGVLAADAAYEALTSRPRRRRAGRLPGRLRRLRAIKKELTLVRNAKPLLTRLGTVLGTVAAGHGHDGHQHDRRLLGPGHPEAQEDRRGIHRPGQGLQAPIAYPKPDGVISFDKLSSVFISNTNHDEDQPSHLKLKDSSVPIRVNLPKYGEPARLYCPAGVYEVVQDGAGDPRFVINAQNCVHCKTCDIKDPSQNIVWTTPEGGGGPNYPNM